MKMPKIKNLLGLLESRTKIKVIQSETAEDASKIICGEGLRKPLHLVEWFRLQLQNLCLGNGTVTGYDTPSSPGGSREQAIREFDDLIGMFGKNHVAKSTLQLARLVNGEVPLFGEDGLEIQSIVEFLNNPSIQSRGFDGIAKLLVDAAKSLHCFECDPNKCQDILCLENEIERNKAIISLMFLQTMSKQSKAEECLPDLVFATLLSPSLHAKSCQQDVIPSMENLELNDEAFQRDPVASLKSLELIALWMVLAPSKSDSKDPETESTHSKPDERRQRTKQILKEIVANTPERSRWAGELSEDEKSSVYALLCSNIFDPKSPSRQRAILLLLNHRASLMASGKVSFSKSKSTFMKQLNKAAYESQPVWGDFLWNFFLTSNRKCSPSHMENSAFPLTSSFVGRDGDKNVKMKSIEERKKRYHIGCSRALVAR